ncbi:MAG: SpoIIE family protein phosphatase [Polyangiaceae bacterium]
MKWWATKRPARGESTCGDDYAIVHGGTTLVALADGLGHGSAALAAAKGFCGAVQQHATEPLDMLMKRGAAAVQGTRGAAAALMRIDEESGIGSYVGVGNIDVRTTSRHISVTSRSGIVGARLPNLLEHHFRVSLGDVIVLFSDGVSGRLKLSDFSDSPHSEWPSLVLERYGKHEDDATCIVLHCDGRHFSAPYTS